MCLRPALVLLALLPLGCDAFEGDPVPFAAAPGPADLQVTAPRTAVFTDAPSWTVFWDAHVNGSDERGPTPAPAVDFSRYTLAAVFWGSGHVGCGSRVEAVRGVRERGGAVEVEVGKLPPLGNCRAVVYPYQVVQVERAGAPVRFTGRVPG